MAVEILETCGLKWSQPVLKIAAKSPDMKRGDVLEVLGDCPTFERDVKAWCDRMKKKCISAQEIENGKFKIVIQF